MFGQVTATKCLIYYSEAKSKAIYKTAKAIVDKLFNKLSLLKDVLVLCVNANAIKLAKNPDFLNIYINNTWICIFTLYLN